MIKLPIDDYLEPIKHALSEKQALVLEAPPGTGKTTRVPAFLAFDCGLKVVVLEPRRIAARQAAMRVAQERGLTHGKEVGHAFRFEAKWGPQTQLLFATEGTFLKLLAKNSFAADVVIIDEFHERHLESDMALALVAATKIKIVVMSATLQGLLLTDYFKNIQIPHETIFVASPLYELTTKYLENNPAILSKSLTSKVVDALEEAFVFGGDVLIFCPGVKEISEVKRSIENTYDDVEVLELHGKLEMSEQAKIFNPANKKKIIVATNIAESSVTVPGVRVVIDSGLARQQQYNLATGFSTLVDVKIAQSNAIQRAGRAAREAKGLCLRLYSKHDFEARAQAVLPDIKRTPLESMRLEMASFNQNYYWFEAPPVQAWEEASRLLRLLGAFDHDERITDLGRSLHQLPLPPTWAKVVLELKECDDKSRKNLFEFLARQLGDQARAIRERVVNLIGPPGIKNEPIERLLLVGFLHALARLRGDDVLSANGKVLKINQAIRKNLSGNEWGLIFDLDSYQRVNTFLEIDIDWLYELEPMPFSEQKTIRYEKQLQLVDTLSIGSLVVEESRKVITLDQVPKELKEQAHALIVKNNEKIIDSFKSDRRFTRIFYAHQEMNSAKLNDYIDEFLTSELSLDVNSFFSYLESMSFTQWNKSLDELVPLQIHGLKVEYSQNEPPFVMNYIQYFYGLKTSPTLNVNGKALTFKLKGPHKRVVQVTTDINGFWQRGYKELLKEMRREYPRHHWPDNPEIAPPVLLKRQLPS